MIIRGYSKYFTRLRFEGEAGTNLVSRPGRSHIVQLLGIDSETKRSLDTRAKSLGVPKSEDTGVVNLGFDKGSRVQVGLGTNLEVNTGSGSLRIIDGLGTSFDIRAHTVIVTGSESGPIAQTMDGDGIIRGTEADSTGATGEATLGDVVRRVGTDEESVTTEDGVGSECWSLEDIKESAGVKTRLLVGGSQQGGLGALLRQQSGSEVELQTLGDLVLQLDLSAKHVRGRPGLG